MKHQNPYYNVTLEEAGKVRSFLNSVCFIVSEIVCNPNVLGQRGVNMMPEINIPLNEECNLEFVFDGVRGSFPVAVIRDLIKHPDLHSLKTLHKSIWPSGAQSDLDARLLRVPAIVGAAQEALKELAIDSGMVEGPEPPRTAPGHPVSRKRASGRRAATKKVRRAAKKSRK